MTPVGKFFGLALAVGTLCGVVALPAGAASPITPANRPTPLPNAVNGEVPPSRLVNVIPNCIAAREAASRKVIERGTIVQRSALIGSSPLAHRIRFLLEMPIANLFDFLL